MPDVKLAPGALETVASFIEVIPDCVLVVQGDARVVAANRAARAMLPALRVDGALALALRDPDILDAIRRVHLSGWAETVSWRDRVPVERSFDVSVAPFDGPDTSRVVVVTLRDLTEQRKVDRMRADFVANASHELRTPLASLLGFVETLQGPARDDASARPRFLAIMAEQARRMARLVDDLLSLSRIEQNLHVRPDQPVDLAIVVRHVADTLAPLAAETGVTIDIKAPDAVVVDGDRDELVRVAENLIENAIKYGTRQSPPAGSEPSPNGSQSSRNGSTVDISVAASQRDGALVVRDHGVGIAAEHLPRLTERFYRIDAGQSRAKGGTGLGLAIVKHIVARHRGRLQVFSEPDHGSSFTVTVPLRKTAP